MSNIRTSQILQMHNSMRDGQIVFPSLLSTDAREKEVPSHFELPLLEYLLQTPPCAISSLVCGSRFLEQAPPIGVRPYKLLEVMEFIQHLKSLTCKFKHSFIYKHIIKLLKDRQNFEVSCITMHVTIHMQQSSICRTK